MAQGEGAGPAAADAVRRVFPDLLVLAIVISSLVPVAFLAALGAADFMGDSPKRWSLEASATELRLGAALTLLCCAGTAVFRRPALWLTIGTLLAGALTVGSLVPQKAATRAPSEPTDPDPNVVELAETLLALPSTWTPLLIGAAGIAAALTGAPRRELARVFPTALVAVLLFVVFGRLLLYGFGEFLLLPLSRGSGPAGGAFAGAGILALLVSAGAWVMLRHRAWLGVGVGLWATFLVLSLASGPGTLGGLSPSHWISWIMWPFWLLIGCAALTALFDPRALAPDRRTPEREQQSKEP